MYLPGPKLKRFIRTVSYDLPIYFIYRGPRLEIEIGKAPVTLQKDERITKKLMRKNTQIMPVLRKVRPIEEALRYAEFLNEPSVDTQTQVAMQFGVSRARVCQMLSLLNLEKSIKQYLLSIKDDKENNFFTERKLRKIAVIKRPLHSYFKTTFFCITWFSNYF